MVSISLMLAPSTASRAARIAGGAALIDYADEERTAGRGIGKVLAEGTHAGCGLPQAFANLQGLAVLGEPDILSRGSRAASCVVKASEIAIGQCAQALPVALRPQRPAATAAPWPARQSTD